MSDSSGKPPRLPPRWFIRAGWKIHRGIYRLNASVVTGEWSGQVQASAAKGGERDRVWARWREIDKELDGLATLRPGSTDVVVL